MAFEQLEKKSRGAPILIGYKVAIRKSYIRFSPQISKEIFPDTKYIEIFLDKQGQRLGFRPTENNVSGFKIHKEKSLAVSMENVSRGTYNAEWDSKENMLIAYGVDIV